MRSLRTPAAQGVYDEYIRTRPVNTACELCEREALKSFMFWKIILNRFPYDRIAENHTMLVPLRHCIERELTPEEYAELVFIKESHLDEYRYILEATSTTKSIPQHLHYHLITLKDFGD